MSIPGGYYLLIPHFRSHVDLMLWDFNRELLAIFPWPLLGIKINIFKQWVNLEAKYLFERNKEYIFCIRVWLGCGMQLGTIVSWVSLQTFSQWSFKFVLRTHLDLEKLANGMYALILLSITEHLWRLFYVPYLHKMKVDHRLKTRELELS